MANIKISDLTAAAAASGTQEFEVNDSLTSKKVTGAQVLAYIESNLTIQNNAVTTAKIADNNVTLAKLQDIATASILGRNTAGTGDPEVLTGAQARTIVGADNASNLTSGTVGTARLGSGTANSTTFLRGDQTWAAAGSTSNVQQFDSSGTWTKPTSGQTTARIQVWGGGGGGSRISSASGCSAGGGGGYNELTVPLSYLASSVSITVGGGGSGATANNVNGSAGGLSSVPLTTSVNGRSTVTAYGGGGGGNANTTFSGGGGGGPLGAGGTATGTAGAPQLLSGTNSGGSPFYEGQAQAGGIWHGGGGAGPGGELGGSSLFGGGGGSVNGTAGTSLWGGNGGNNAPGTAPGGGGGASPSGNVNGSAGAAGRVIITCW